MHLDVVGRSDLPISRTDLESHANMIAVGRNVQIMSHHVRTAEDSSFAPNCELTHHAHVVCTSIRNDNEETGKIFMLIVRDSLSVPDVNHNLLAPFATRETVIYVRNTPKFQVEDVFIDDHSSCFPQEEFENATKIMWCVILLSIDKPVN